MQVPRLIHQIYLQGDLPERLKEQVGLLKQRNPNWEHRLYDLQSGEDLIRNHFGARTLKALMAINPDYGAARADLMRHLILHQFGGVYLDIKSDLVRPLDEVVRPDDEYLLSQWRNAPGQLHEGFGLHPELSHIPGGEFQTYFLIGRKRHPFSKAAIEAITSNILHYRPWSGVGKMGVIRTTGPSAYTLAVHPILHTAAYRMVSEDEVGARMSINNYAHQDVFKRHYSVLTSPVARLAYPSRMLQLLIERLRQAKYDLQESKQL